MPVFDQRDRTIRVRRTEIHIDRVWHLGAVFDDTHGWHFTIYYGETAKAGSWLPMHFDTELEAHAIHAILQEYVNARAV